MAVPPLAFASVQDRKRLLELYSIASLRGQWPRIGGTKDELCFAVASDDGSQGAIVDFARTFLTTCRQHVFVFSHNLDLNHLPAIAIPDAEKVAEYQDDGTRQIFYLHQFVYNVVLRDPLEEAELRFLWPIRLDFTVDHLAVKFITLEKNIATYFDGRSYYISRRSADEKSVLKEIEKSIKIEPADLHQGIKTLWDNDVIDSPRAKFKKTYSTSDEAMDENRYIKEHDPELYEIVKDLPLFNTLFHVLPDNGINVDVFSVDPSRGIINFPRYSENVGDTDHLVREILRQNQ